MKLARVMQRDGKVCHAIVHGSRLVRIDGNILGSWTESETEISREEARLLAPIQPANILCIGRNYRAHAEETGHQPPSSPVMFIKATSCICDPEAPIRLPDVAPDHVDYEAELAVVIGKTARNVETQSALDYVLGFTCANDVTARDCQQQDGQWCRAKSFDTFGPFGPWIETEIDPRNLRIQGRLNGQIVQDESTSALLFDVPALISYLSRGMTLLPGTVILTGTPAGCGFVRHPPIWLRAGDVFEVEIEGIGVLRNPIVCGAG